LSGDATPYALLRVAQLALKVEAQHMALDEDKDRLLDAAAANAAIDEIAGAMRDALLNWPARVSGQRSGPIRISCKPCCSITSQICWRRRVPGSEICQGPDAGRADRSGQSHYCWQSEAAQLCCPGRTSCGCPRHPSE